jgi:dihydrolipoamide dehydrogenase
MTEFDIAVIGAGPGGYVAAIRAAQQGASVCLVERDKLGGACLNRGCIPTKALSSTARLLCRIKNAAAHGIQINDLRFDYGKAVSRKDDVVQKLVGGVEQLLKSNGVEIFRAHGSLEGSGRICIRQEEVVKHIRSKNIILATGSVPARPKSLPTDGRNVLTSDEILVIKELPESLLVIGGGYIGCEFASIFSSLGTKVTIIEQLPNLLVGMDRQAVREVEKVFIKQGVAIYTDTTLEDLEVSDGSVIARLSGGKAVRAEKALVAVGRIPSCEGLELEKAGVRVEKGAIAVDDCLRTSAKGVFAIGDVIGGIQLAHIASYQAGIAVTNALGGKARVNYRVVPSVIYTFPEIAQVGLTEEECKEQRLEIKIGRFSYLASGKALCDGENQGMVKIIADRNEAILGASIVGEEASCLVAEVAAAMYKEYTVGELGQIIHSHPTLPEMIKEASEDAVGMAVHKMARKPRRRSSAAE